MGFTKLVLVKPRANPRDIKALEMAVNSWDILESALEYDSLKEAVKNSGLVIGTTGRLGKKKINILTPMEMAQMLIPIIGERNVSIVFGPEDTGLTNEDLALCQWIVAIPTGSPFNSLNLSHAVILICYELCKIFFHSREKMTANSQELEILIQHMERILLEIGFIKENDPKRMMVKLRQMFYNACLDSRETRIIHAILSQMELKLKGLI